jgi:hypothetical protein
MTNRVRLLAGQLMIFAAVLVIVGMFGFVRGAAAQDEASVTADLAEQNDSGITGTAVLTADGDQTIVVIQLNGAEEGTEGHMFDNTCDNHQGATIFYPLEPVSADGHSESVVDAPLSLLADGKHWIHLHEPAVERGEGVACGNVPALSAGGVLPSSGVGTMAGDSSSGILSSASVALALGAVVISFLLLRRREIGTSGPRD